MIRRIIRFLFPIIELREWRKEWDRCYELECERSKDHPSNTVISSQNMQILAALEKLKPKPNVGAPTNDDSIDYSGKNITPKMRALVPGLTDEMAKEIDWRRLG